MTSSELEPGIVTDLIGRLSYAVFKIVYDDPERWWDAYEMAEKLVDVEESFQLWRLRHLKTVERIIGHKPGTGGSYGVGFLKRALDHQFFPELIDVRTVLEPRVRP